MGQVSLFLNLKTREETNLKMVIRTIDVLGENNQWVPLTESPIEVDSSSIEGGQMFLGRTFLLSGYYSRLRLNALPGTEHEENKATLKSIELEIPSPLYVSPGDSHSLFLLWDPLATLAEDDQRQPGLSLLPNVRKMMVDMAFVACPEINTVYVICTDTNRVCDSLGVKGEPSYLVSDGKAPTTNLYALTQSDGDIKKIGPAANRVEANFYLSSLGKELHFAVSKDSQWAYVIDQKMGSILRLNLQSGSIDLRNRLGYKPSYILYLDKPELIAVSLSLSQTVVLLDPQTLQIVQSIPTAGKPEGLMLYNENLLYIAEAASHSVLVYDITRNQIVTRIPVDLSPRRILAANGLIYVANHGSRSVSVLRPGQLGVSKSINLNGPPLEMAYSSSNKWLYVGNDHTRALDIIDPVTGKRTGGISLGARPQGIAILAP